MQMMVRLAAMVPATRAGLWRNITNRKTVAIKSTVAKIGTRDRDSQDIDGLT